MSPDLPTGFSGSCLWCSKLASSSSKIWLRPCRMVDAIAANSSTDRPSQPLIFVLICYGFRWRVKGKKINYCFLEVLLVI